MVKYPFCISDSSRCFSPSFLFTFLFLFYSCLFLLLLLHPSPPHPPSLSSAVFPLSPLSAAASLFPLLSCQLPRRQCCHGYRAAGQISWCLVSFRHVHKSVSCMRALFLPFPSEACLWSLRLLFSSRPLSPCFFFFSFTRWSLSVSSTYHHPQLQCDLTDFVYKLRWMLHMCSYVILF